jgi:hypothetical protein
MAHFYADVKGGRKEKTATGTINSGLTAHIRGWDVGVRIECTHESVTVKGKKKEIDICKIYRTGGSNSPASGTLLAVAQSK